MRVLDLTKSKVEEVYTNLKHLKIATREDILMTFDGSPGIVKRGLEGAFSSGVRKVIIKNPLVLNREFFYYILQSHNVQKTIQENSYGTTLIHATKAIYKTTIPLPSLPEQKKIAEILNLVDAKIEAAIEKKRQLELLKKGLMQDLLTGRIRFPEFIKNELSL